MIKDQFNLVRLTKCYHLSLSLIVHTQIWQNLSSGKQMTGDSAADVVPAPVEGQSTDWLGSSLSRSESRRDWSDRSFRQVRRWRRAEAGRVGVEEQPEQPTL